MRITISGVPGAGKTSVAKLLANKLNYEYFSMGTILRELAKQKGMSIVDLSLLAEKDKKIDEELDNMQKKFSLKDNFVMDSRLGFYFIPNSFKIFLTCPVKVAAERILKDSRENEKYKDLDDAVQKIKLRRASEKRRYKNLYGIDYTDPKYFDLLIDTSDKSVKDIVNIILYFLKEKFNIE
ncbi:MAG: CMP/dCMP kinase [Candidatus Woesearchaeota archaeon]|nr:CMP/dCMP kinase [Candidatus Woesearchaeota archaeon]